MSCPYLINFHFFLKKNENYFKKIKRSGIFAQTVIIPVNFKWKFGRAVECTSLEN